MVESTAASAHRTTGCRGVDVIRAWVEYRNVELLPGYNSFGELVLGKTGTGQTECFGRATACLGGVVERACLLVEAMSEQTTEEWQKLLQLGLPAECIVKMEFRKTGPDILEWIVKCEGRVSLYDGGLFGTSPSMEAEQHVRISWVYGGTG